MRNSIQLGAALLGVTLLAGCARPSQTGRERAAGEGRVVIGIDSTEVRAAVDKENTNYVDALLTGNAQLFASCFTENGAVLLPDGRVVQGRDSIFTFLRPVFRTTRVTEGRTTTERLYVVDEYAFEIGQWAGAAGPISGQSVRADSGQYVRIWKRDDRRDWKIWRDIVRRGLG